RDRQLREAVEPFDAFRGEVVLGAEVGDLGRDAAAERSRIETREFADGGPTGGESRPQTIRGRADGGHGAHAREHHASPSIPPAPSLIRLKPRLGPAAEAAGRPVTRRAEP